jgi:hypothetical protein
MVKYTLEEQGIVYDSYMKNKSYKRKFTVKYPGVQVSDSS